MATAIRVPLQGDPVGKLEAIREKAKQLRSDLKDTQRDMLETARAGQTVAKEVTENYARLRRDLKNTDELIKTQKQRMEEVRERHKGWMEKRKEEQAKEREIEEGHFGKGNLRGLKSIEHIASGNINPHSIRHFAETVGAEKLAETAARVIPLVALGKMIMDMATERFREETEKTVSHTENMNKLMATAKQSGLDKKMVGVLNKHVRDHYLKEAKSASAHSLFNPFTYESVKDIMDSKKSEIEGAQKQELARFEALRNMDVRQFGITSDKIYAEAQKRYGKNFTTQDANRVRDEMIVGITGSLEARNLVMSAQEQQRMMEAEKKAKAERMEWDQDFAQDQRDKQEYKDMAHKLRNLRFHNAPTD